jgi:hypothetical protein
MATSFLQDVKSRDLRAISFRIFINEGRPQPDFESLSHILMSDKFRRVDRVRFMYTGDLATGAVLDALTKAFPGLNSRGLLHVLDTNDRRYN